ncbi:MAG: oligopeptide/dipeptide ABC transporter ATP-binding protein, partial [Anaerolineales bacterium]
MPTLKVEDLSVSYRLAGTSLHALRSVSLHIEPGQIYGIVGESGSGKSTLAQAVMGYLPENGVVESGQIAFQGQDLSSQSRSAMRAIWGARIGFVPQDPYASLNPSILVGLQIGEVLQRHRGLHGAPLRQRVMELLEMVRLADPGRIYRSYPHQLSGGQQQRTLIAIALSTEPPLLVMDEPTTGLDTTTQAAVLDLICELMNARGTAALYVTHNLGVVARVCDRVAVLYAGELVEDGPTGAVYQLPLHPYTQGLLDSVPRWGENKRAVRMRPIMGRIPDLNELPAGCIFQPRCPIAVEICTRAPPLYSSGPERVARCHRWEEIQHGQVSARQPVIQDESPGAAGIGHDSVLEVSELEVHFSGRSPLGALFTGRPDDRVRAVNGIDLQLERGRTLGLVGESGSGKTTLARAVMGLIPRTAGRIELLGEELAANLNARDKQTRS